MTACPPPVRLSQGLPPFLLRRSPPSLTSTPPGTRTTSTLTWERLSPQQTIVKARERMRENQSIATARACEVSIELQRYPQSTRRPPEAKTLTVSTAVSAITTAPDLTRIPRPPPLQAPTQTHQSTSTMPRSQPRTGRASSIIRPRTGQGWQARGMGRDKVVQYGG